MRLTCPNCGAQYAVDARVIPDDGRDVQCSSCGHTWFQRPPELEAELQADALSLDDASAPPENGALPQTEPTEDDEPEFETSPLAAAPQVADPPMPPRRTVDAEALAVLREEAERERRARAAESLEVQGELDMSAPDATVATNADRPSEAPSSVDRHPDMHDEMLDDMADDEALRPAPRRTLLPDIEEINSTLTPSDHGPMSSVASAESSAQLAARQRNAQGRRYGFALAVAVFALLTLAYSQGQRIGAAVPGAAPMLDRYGAQVDSLRLKLDDALRAAVSSDAPAPESPLADGTDS